MAVKSRIKSFDRMLSWRATLIKLRKIPDKPRRRYKRIKELSIPQTLHLINSAHPIKPFKKAPASYIFLELEDAYSIAISIGGHKSVSR